MALVDGIYLGGEKWMYIRSDDRLVVGKKVRQHVGRGTHASFERCGARRESGSRASCCVE